MKIQAHRLPLASRDTARTHAALERGETGEVMLSSGQEKGKEAQRKKIRETGRRWRGEEQNCVLACK